MHVLVSTQTSTNESALLATFTHGYEGQLETLPDASTSENEWEPRSLLIPYHPLELLTATLLEFAGAASPNTTTDAKDKTYPSV